MTKEKIERLDEMRTEAVWRYFEKMDIDVSEFIEGEDRKEYHALYMEIYGDCPFCGEIKDNCECEL